MSTVLYWYNVYNECKFILDVNLVLRANLYFFSFIFQVVKELLVKETGLSSDLLGSDVEWCREEELPEETRCKVRNKGLILCLFLWCASLNFTC
jgi:hypothetical protein